MSLTNYELWTFRDAVEHVLDSMMGGDQSEKARRNAIRAVLKSYRDLPGVRNWSCFYRRLKVSTAAATSTGSLQSHFTRPCGSASVGSGRARRWATSAMPSRSMPRAMASAWCANSAATASAPASTKSRKCCIKASREPA